MKGKGRAGNGEEGKKRGASGISGEPRQGPSVGSAVGGAWGRGEAGGAVPCRAAGRPQGRQEGYGNVRFGSVSLTQAAASLERTRKALTSPSGPSQARHCVPHWGPSSCTGALSSERRSVSSSSPQGGVMRSGAGASLVGAAPALARGGGFLIVVE